MSNNKLDRTQIIDIDTLQAFGTLVTAARYQIEKVFRWLKNPYALVVIVLLFTAMISVSLYRDNKVPFKEIVYVEKIEKKITVLSAAKPKKKVTKPNTITPADRSIEIVPSTTNTVSDIKPATKSEIDEVPRSVQKDFLKTYSNISIQEMDRTGIPASITMAQAVIESRFGTSTLARETNNHFGIKCFSKSCKPGHCVNKYDDFHKDFFRTYKTVDESFIEHSNFLMKNTYRKLLKFGKDYRSWAKGLREYGYATDKQYDKKLIQVIEKYDLTHLDYL